MFNFCNFPLFFLKDGLHSIYKRFFAPVHDFDLMKRIADRVVADAETTVDELKKDIESGSLHSIHTHTDDNFKKWYTGILKLKVSELEEEFYK